MSFGAVSNAFGHNSNAFGQSNAFGSCFDHRLGTDTNNFYTLDTFNESQSSTTLPSTLPSAAREPTTKIYRDSLGHVAPPGSNLFGLTPVDADYVSDYESDDIESDSEGECFIGDERKIKAYPKPPEYFAGERERLSRCLLSLIDETVKAKVLDIETKYIRELSEINGKFYGLLFECSKKTRKIGLLNREIMRLREEIAASSAEKK